MRLRGLWDPRSGLRSWSFNSGLLGRLDAHEVLDRLDPAAVGGCVLQDDRVVEAAQPERANGLFLALTVADRALDVGDFDLRHWSSPPPARLAAPRPVQPACRSRA